LLLSGRDLCVGLIPCPEESYRLMCRCVLSRNRKNEESLAPVVPQRLRKKNKTSDTDWELVLFVSLFNKRQYFISNRLRPPTSLPLLNVEFDVTLPEILALPFNKADAVLRPFDTSHILHSQHFWKFNPLTPELNPSAQRCLTKFFTRDFAYWTVHFVNICVKNQQMHQLFIQFINCVW
jgi:hypothetical protein